MIDSKNDAVSEPVRGSNAIASPHSGSATDFSALRTPQGANSRTWCMISGLTFGCRHALGSVSCLLLDGRIV